MGIHGLTSYVTNHAVDCLTDFKLHNCLVLIDGNSAASLIYSILTHSNHAFGGDYDKYAKSTVEFIQLLRKCKVHPIFIFDGGYELKKLRTVTERIKMNIMICGQYKNKYRESRTFPLLLREDFKAILRSQDVPVIQCDFEADAEITVLAKILKCPIISNDSDFYINDVTYIPFPLIEFKAVRLKKKAAKFKYYVPCKRFNNDTFLNRFGGLSNKSLLPLLSCILGNDYIQPNTFKNFLKINYCLKFDEKIQRILNWMKEITSVDEAIEQMMITVEKNKRNIQMTIRQMLSEYNRNTSQYLNHISKELLINEELSEHFSCLSIADHFEKFNYDNLNCHTNCLINEELVTTINDSECYVTDDRSSIENEDGIIVLEVQEYEMIRSDCETDCSEDEKGSDVEEKNGTLKNLDDSDNIITIPTKPKIPDWFLEKFRIGLITPNVINVINFQRIFIPSQSEDYYSKPSHEICLPILKFIVGIVLRDVPVHYVKCHARIRSMQIGVYHIVPIFESLNYGRLPDLLSIENMDIKLRANILLDCLNISENSNLNLFPEEWKLFILILFYWKKNCKQTHVNGSHIRTIMICLIYLNIVDRKIGFIRSPADLRKYCKVNSKSLNEILNTNILESEINDQDEVTLSNNMNELNSLFVNDENSITITDFLNFVSETDCLKTADALLPYHQIDPYLLKNRKEFNVKLVHTFAQLQHCIQNILTLNAVLNFPFMPCQPHLIFSGTFLYNLCLELNNRKLADGYITRTLLAKTNTIICLYRYLIISWETLWSKKMHHPKLEIKKKKKTRKKNPQTIENNQSEDDTYDDPENIYSLLSAEVE